MGQPLHNNRLLMYERALLNPDLLHKLLRKTETVFLIPLILWHLLGTRELKMVEHIKSIFKNIKIRVLPIDLSISIKILNIGKKWLYCLLEFM